MDEKSIKDVVKQHYSEIASQGQSCCCSCGCGTDTLVQAGERGYLAKDLECIPQEAILGLGCGNPVAASEPKEGEIVLDLGAGAGIDVFLAARSVGEKGRVIGVDMTQEMIDKARGIAETYDYKNVEFRLGEIEALPVEDETVNVVISNCVINLAPDKSKVFKEAYRVLKPKGRLVVSDIVAENNIPPELKNDPDAWSGCIAGALEQNEYLGKIKQAGFTRVKMETNREFYVECGDKMEKLISTTVKAYKPAAKK